MFSRVIEREYSLKWVKSFFAFRKSKKEQPYPLKKVVSLDEMTESDKKTPLSANGKEILSFFLLFSEGLIINYLGV